MNDEGDDLSRFRNQLHGNQAEQWSALRELADLDEYSWQLVRELTPVIVNYLSDPDSNALESERAGSALESFIEAHPDAVAAEIGNQSDLIPSEHEPAIEHVLEALVTMEEEHPGFLAGKNMYLSDLLDERSKDIRYHAARLHGAIATEAALQELEDVLNRVGDDAARAGAFDGYEAAIKRVSLSLADRESQPLDAQTAVDSLSYMADHQPQLLEEHWEQFIGGLRTPFHETVADALVKTVAISDETAVVGREVITTVLEMASENVQSTGDVAARICSLAPGVVGTIADYLPKPSVTDIGDIVESVPSGIDGRLLAGLISDRYRIAAAGGLDTRITTGSADVTPLANALVDLIAYKPTSDKAAELLALLITRQPDQMVKEFVTVYPSLESALRAEDLWNVRVSAQVLTEYVQTKRTIADRIVDDILTRVIPVRDESPESIFGVLDMSSECYPTTISDRVEHVVELAAADDETVRRGALDLLGTALEPDTPAAVDALSEVLGCLEDPDPTVRGKAIEAIVEIGIQPAPPELRALSDDDSASDEVRRRATQAVTTIKQNYTPESIRTTYARTGAAILSDDDGDVELRYWSPESGWQPLEFGIFRKGLLERIREQHSRSPGTGIPALLPYYEPSDVITLALNFVLRSSEDDCKVVLFSPGTRTQWGQKSEVREEIARYGLAFPDSSPLTAARLPDIVPHAHVSDGEPVRDSEGTGPGELIITKQLTELLSMSPKSVDVIIFHLCSRRKDEWEDLLQTVDDRFVDATTVTAYSHFTKNEREGSRPGYGPPEFLGEVLTLPGEESISRAIAMHERREGATDDTTEGENSSWNEGVSNRGLVNDNWILGDSELVAHRNPPVIQIDEIDATEIDSLLEQVFEDSAQLEDVDDDGGSYRIFSEQMFFERLPTPVSEYDSWIRDEWQAGKPVRFLPDVSEERLNGLRTFGEQVENLEVPEHVFAAEKKLRRVRDQLKKSNPMFDAIVENIEKANREQSSLAIFVPSPSLEGVLRRAFENSTAPITPSNSSLVHIVTPDTARKIDPVDTLLIPGPAHPQHKCYYVHPRAGSIKILTYNRLWAGMVKRHAIEYVNRLNNTTGIPDYRPFEPPRLEGDIEPDGDRDSESEEETDLGDPADIRSGSSSQDGRSSPRDTRREKMDLLASAMETASDKEYSDSSSRYVDEYRIYEIEFDDGTTTQRSNTDTILRRRHEDTGSKQLQWVRPQLLATGDRVVLIPRDTKQELWRERLHELYAEEIHPSAVDDLRIWYQTIEDIKNQISTELSADPSNRAIFDEIYRRVNQEGFKRRKETLVDWFESVQSADDPLELAEDPSLTIGPQNQDDIRVLGEAFGEQGLREDYESIEAAMRGLRTVNRNEGREFQDWLLEQVLAEEENRVNKLAHTEEVVSVTDVSNR